MKLKKIHDNTILNESLQQVVKGTFTVYTGLIIGIIFAFIGRTLFARFFTTTEYGVFSLGITLFSLLYTIGLIGLQDGVTRQIAYYYGKEKIKQIQSVVYWSIIFGFLSSLILFLITFFGSDIIAFKIFNIPELSNTLKIFSIAMPFIIFLSILLSIFRGFKKVKEQVYFMNLLRNILFLLFLIPVILFNMSFDWGIVAYVFSIILTCCAFLIYFFINKPVEIKFLLKNVDISSGKELLFFSLPLLIVTILYQIMTWMDTLMLGFLTPADIVGLYNSASPLGQFISSALGAMLIIYVPIVSTLYANGKNAEMKKSYTILTKWICVATLPMALVLILFPDTVLNFIFGSKYVSAGNVLQILAIGFFINNLMGPNGATLTAIGKTKFLMNATFVAVCINFLLNMYLIPLYGMNGASIATVTALVSINIIRSIKLYSISKVHSLNKNILKPIVLTITISIFIFIIIKDIFTITYWMLPFIFIFFIVLCGFSLLFTKSISEEDINILLMIEKRVGINLKKFKKFISKFI